MGGDKKLETMQEELKLLKGELKQSLASVRDYLLNMELPASEFSNILEALDSGEGQKVTMSGSLGTPEETRPPEETKQEVVESAPETLAEDENLIDVEGPLADESRVLEAENLGDQEEETVLEETALARDESGEESQPEVPYEGEEAPGLDSGLPLLDENQAYERAADEATLATPKVNMLANLIPWVARAKKEIGYDQLPTLLEVYGISGHLSPELKEIIIQLAQITAEKPEVANDPQLWSQAMLSLHGILTGGDAPLHPVLPFLTETDEETPLEEEEEEPEEETPLDSGIKLKLIFPHGEGKSKEYCINLTPEEEEEEVAPRRSKDQKSSRRER
jgi:hypothetical protein